MTTVLKIWGCYWKSAILVPTPFKIKSSWFKKVTNFSGFAYKHKGSWWAVWKDGERLMLQNHAEKWQIGNGKCQLLNIGNGLRRLEIKSPNVQLLCVEYSSSSFIEDPTHDLVDEETEDFFFWIYRIWNDPSWTDALLKRYS